VATVFGGPAYAQGSSVFPATTPVTVDLNCLRLGQDLTNNTAQTITGFAGQIDAVLVFNAVLTDAQVKSAYRALRWLEPEKVEDIFIGDSRTAMQYSGLDYPHQFMSGLNYAQTYLNLGVGGTTAKLLTFSPSPGSSITNYLFARPPWVTVNVYYHYGINDFYANGDSASNVYGYATNLLAICQALGFNMIPLTVYCVGTNSNPALGGYTYNPTYEAARMLYNQYLATNTVAFAGVGRPDLVIGQLQLSTNGYVNSIDGLHFYGATNEAYNWGLIAQSAETQNLGANFTGGNNSDTNVSTQSIMAPSFIGAHIGDGSKLTGLPVPPIYMASMLSTNTPIGGPVTNTAGSTLYDSGTNNPFGGHDFYSGPSGGSLTMAAGITATNIANGTQNTTNKLFFTLTQNGTYVVKFWVDAKGFSATDFPQGYLFCTNATSGGNIIEFKSFNTSAAAAYIQGYSEGSLLPIPMSSTGDGFAVSGSTQNRIGVINNFSSAQTLNGWVDFIAVVTNAPVRVFATCANVTSTTTTNTIAAGSGFTWTFNPPQTPQ
jgi:hypothetical protein